MNITAQQKAQYIKAGYTHIIVWVGESTLGARVEKSYPATADAVETRVAEFAKAGIDAKAIKLEDL